MMISPKESSHQIRKKLLQACGVELDTHGVPEMSKQGLTWKTARNIGLAAAN